MLLHTLVKNQLKWIIFTHFNLDGLVLLRHFYIKDIVSHFVFFLYQTDHTRECWPHIKGYTDVGDGCWRRNLLVTTLRYWWRFWPVSSPISKFCYQHPKIAINIKSPKSMLHKQAYSNKWIKNDINQSDTLLFHSVYNFSTSQKTLFWSHLWHVCT